MPLKSLQVLKIKHSELNDPELCDKLAALKVPSLEILTDQITKEFEEVFRNLPISHKSLRSLLKHIGTKEGKLAVHKIDYVSKTYGVPTPQQHR